VKRTILAPLRPTEAGDRKPGRDCYQESLGALTLCLSQPLNCKRFLVLFFDKKQIVVTSANLVFQMTHHTPLLFLQLQDRYKKELLREQDLPELKVRIRSLS